MPKVKLTKTALKQERDSLKQFQRFLPTLQLKKQQLQLEMRTCLERIASNEQREEETKKSLSGWMLLFGAETVPARIGEILKIGENAVLLPFADKSLNKAAADIFDGHQSKANAAFLYGKIVIKKLLYMYTFAGG